MNFQSRDAADQIKNKNIAPQPQLQAATAPRTGARRTGMRRVALCSRRADACCRALHRAAAALSGRSPQAASRLRIPCRVDHLKPRRSEGKRQIEREREEIKRERSG